MAINAISGLPTKYDLVGPTVDDDVRRLIARWGANAVKDSIKAQTKPQRGRKPEKDWPKLWPYIERDAREWLEGGDPLARWSDYAVAKSYADEHPGHSHPATMKRIIGRLQKSRRTFMLYEAERMSRDSYPVAANLRALCALAEERDHPVWVSVLEMHRRYITDYTSKYGAPPPDSMSMAEVEEASKRPVTAPDGTQYMGILERALAAYGK